MNLLVHLVLLRKGGSCRGPAGRRRVSGGFTRRRWRRNRRRLRRRYLWVRTRQMSGDHRLGRFRPFPNRRHRWRGLTRGIRDVRAWQWLRWWCRRRGRRNGFHWRWHRPTRRRHLMRRHLLGSPTQNQILIDRPGRLPRLRCGRLLVAAWRGGGRRGLVEGMHWGNAAVCCGKSRLAISGCAKPRSEAFEHRPSYRLSRLLAAF